MTVTIQHHGAVDGVTGSCHELRLSESAGVLIDCGLFQGAETSGHGATRERLAIEFPIDHIKALVLTHVHIDHCGRVPHLLAAGFQGPVYLSKPSAILLPLVIEDALKVGVTRNRALIDKVLNRLKRQLRPIDYKVWTEINTGDSTALAIRLQRAGHILGSAYVECKITASNPASAEQVGPQAHPQPDTAVKEPIPGSPTSAGQAGLQAHPVSGAAGSAAPPVGPALAVSPKTLPQTTGAPVWPGAVGPASAGQKQRQIVVFSGDLGAPNTPLLPPPKPPSRADTLVIESTYGDRLHEDRRTRIHRLQRVIERALENRGTVLIPAFSIGRTQELLYELEEIIHRCRNKLAARDLPWSELEIVVDSPLAAKFTRVYRRLKPYWDAEAQARVRARRHPLSFTQLRTVDSHQDHLKIVRHLSGNDYPCIVLAASGMCAGGRIVNYLKALIGKPETDVLFVGYQARGTPGRDIQEYGPRGGWVELDGKRFTIRAAVHTVSGYSAHADQANLLRFVTGIRKPPAEIRIVHGDDGAKAELQRLLQARLPDTLVTIGGGAL